MTLPPPQGVMAEPELTRLHYESGKLDAEFATDAAKYLAESFRDLCDKHGAQNYLQMKMHDPEGREFVVTVQRGGHPTAHDLRRQAEAQNTALLARCEGLEAALRETRTAILGLEARRGAGEWVARTALCEHRMGTEQANLWNAAIRAAASLAATRTTGDET